MDQNLTIQMQNHENSRDNKRPLYTNAYDSSTHNLHARQATGALCLGRARYVHLPSSKGEHPRVERERNGPRGSDGALKRILKVLCPT